MPDPAPTRIRDAFLERWGRPPDAIWAAPGRVNLIGEHTDYNDGFVLPVAIDRTVVVALATRHDTAVRMWSFQEGATELDLEDVAPGAVHGWAAYPAGVACVLRRLGVDARGFDLVVDGDVPVGAGLSSSAALECAVGAGLAGLAGADLDAPDLARAAQRAEVEVVGVPCGIMDQMAAVACRADHAMFLDTRSLRVEHVPLGLGPAGLRLLVVDTRAARRLVEGAYAQRRADCEAAARALGVPALRDASAADLQAARLGERLLRRARHVITENRRVLDAVALLRRGRVSELGPLLDASHASLRDDFEVSGPELDAAVQAATGAGAIGARMTGAGFGGCAIALVPQERVDAVAAAVVARFSERRFRAPEVFPVRAVDGASRLA